MPTTLRLGTRASALALTQSEQVAAQLRALGHEVELVRVKTEGDRATGSLAGLGGTGVFVTALREALLEDRCDIAVHSLKDLPTGRAAGILVAAVPPREDPRDVLCARDGLTLRTLPAGARVGTGSPRRAAQLRLVRPDLEVVDIRGNVDTRLARVAAGGTGANGGREVLDAVVLARAGLARLGRLDAVTEVLGIDVMAPAPGQGALAVECRADDADVLADADTGLRSLDHLPTRLAVSAERALLARLEAGCSAPVGALGRFADDGALELLATAVAPSGQAFRGTRRARVSSVAGARELGASLAEELLDAGLPGVAAHGAALPSGTPTAPPIPRDFDA